MKCEACSLTFEREDEDAHFCPHCGESYTAPQPCDHQWIDCTPLGGRQQRMCQWCQFIEITETPSRWSMAAADFDRAKIRWDQNYADDHCDKWEPGTYYTREEAAAGGQLYL